ncbi:MAG: ABC transporter ATP-binding protein [Candidatus Latescibacterota bacterium]
MREAELASRGLDPRLMTRLLAHLRPYAGWVLLTFVLIVAAAVVGQAGPYLTKIAVDDCIELGDAAGLGRVILLYVGLLVAQFGLGYGRSWATSMIGQWAMRDVRLRIFTHLQRLPVRYFDRTPIGRLMARNTSDVDALNDLFTDGVVSMCSDLFTVATILGYVLYMDLELGLLTVAVLPLGAGATVWLQRRTFHAFRAARTRFGAFAASLQETISGMEVVQLFGLGGHCTRQVRQANDAYLEARLTSTLYHAVYFPCMELFGSLLLALVLWHGSGQVLRQEIAWGVVVAMLQYVPRFFMPIRDIAERYSTLQVAMASAERIFEILDTPAEDPGGHTRPQVLQGEIEFRHVWFAYAGEDWVLRDVSFRAASGQSLALVGATGAGKSTIISLLCRFYEVQRGSVLVDGVDVRQWDVRQLRRRIGVVHQDVFLFSGSIARNISLGDPRMPRQQVERVAGDVNADRFIRRLPEGYDHLIGERGASLSAGQRQLLSFARALASDPDILVLDEATSSVDTQTEVWIQEAVARLMRGRTCVVIAHRLSTIRSADRILVLHRGRLREEGRHEELLARRGVYYRLHQLQYSLRSAAEPEEVARPLEPAPAIVEEPRPAEEQ